MLGKARLAALAARARVAEAVKGAAELAGPRPSPCSSDAEQSQSTSPQPPLADCPLRAPRPAC